MNATTDLTLRSTTPASPRQGWLVALVAVVAFLARLVPDLRGAGLFGRNTYDGSVHYAAAAGLAHGLLPYRDFLFLHPPGILLALLPFAALGRVIGDGSAMALAGLVWMGVGAVNAVLVWAILRPLGRFAAALGGLFYAVFFPAVFIDRSTLLEGPGALLTLGAVLLLTRTRGSRDVPVRVVLLAGLLLGLSSGVKIWGVVTLLAVLLWATRVLGVRLAGSLLLGSVVGVSAVCLPFFLAAPRQMWRMVVLDQLGRPRTALRIGTRLTDLAGLTLLPSSRTLIAVALLAGLAGCALAARWPPARLVLLILAAEGALLFLTPTWFIHYAGLTAAPVAVVVGAASAALVGALPTRRWRAATGTLLLFGLAGYAVPGFRTSFGAPFPAGTIAAATAGVEGCVTTDDPTVLIETGLLERNLARGCRYVVDLGGYSYDVRPAQAGVRKTNMAWQRLALDYLGSGSAVVVVRFADGPGFSPETTAAVDRWPVLARAGKFAVRRPGTVPTPGR